MLDCNPPDFLEASGSSPPTILRGFSDDRPHLGSLGRGHVLYVVRHLSTVS